MKEAITVVPTFRKIAGRYLEPSERQLLPKYTGGTNVIPVPDLSFMTCVSAISTDVVQCEQGFDAESLKQKVTRGVIQGSWAFKAGVREGQQIVRGSVNWNDITKPVRVTLRGADRDDDIEFYPRGPVISATQYKLKPR